MIIETDRSKTESLFHTLKSEMTDRLPVAVKYLDLGIKTVRVLCYTDRILPIIEKQFSFVLKNQADAFDETLVVWDGSQIGELSVKVFNDLDAGAKRKVRAEMLWLREKYPCLEICTNDSNSYFFVKKSEGRMEAYDSDGHIAYCAYDSFEPEEFVKHGHAFVRTINKLVKSDTSNLVHGAVAGYGGNGFLLCGRGKRGKSTLTVESLLSGFEFVSDDYQILSKPKEEVLVYPIYSIITLSYRMYNEMYDRFDGKFVCNNFSQDKYIFEISCYHDRFRTAYPVKFCLFPEIVADEYPSIKKCSASEKGRAIVQLIHSTLSQMNELSEERTISKIYEMVKELPFYKFNLSNDIGKNTEYLKGFLETYSEEDEAPFDEPVIFDITYGLATVIDLRKNAFFDMNKFTTNIFSLLLSGQDPEEIRDMLKGFSDKNPHISEEYDSFLRLIRQRNFDRLDFSDYPCPQFSAEYAEKSEYKLSMRSYAEDRFLRLI